VGTDKRARQKEQHQSRLETARLEAKRKARVARFTRIGAIVSVVAVALIVVAVFSGNDNEKSPDEGSTTTEAASASTSTPAGVAPTCPPTDGSAERTTAFTGPFPENGTDPTKTYTAKVITSEGEFTIALDPERAPKTVNNFVTLARWKFYDGLTFHRIVSDFVIQGGDPQGNGQGGPGYSFEDELPKPEDYQAYSLAMANSGPNTNGSQFFVVLSDNGAKTLSSAVGGKAAYSLFGQVTTGQDVVDTIGKAEKGPDDKPLTPITINSVSITES